MIVWGPAPAVRKGMPRSMRVCGNPRCGRVLERPERHVCRRCAWALGLGLTLGAVFGALAGAISVGLTWGIR